MKDIMMLMGFSMGLLTGALLYKYSQNAKSMIDQGEKKIVKEAKKLEKKAEQGMEELESKVKKGVKKIEDKITNN